MIRIDFITLLAIFGAFQGLLFAVFIWFRNKFTFNKIFALLLLATSIRIAKNIVVHASEIDPEFSMNLNLWRFLVNFGITHQFAIGPLFYLYFLARMDRDFKFRNVSLWHFVPYFLLILGSYHIQWPFWRDVGLWLSYISILTYYLLAFRAYHVELHKRSNKENDSLPTSLIWLRNLLIIVAILLFSYSPVLFKYLGYIGGAVLYTIGIYMVSMIILKQKRTNSLLQAKYQTTTLNKELFESIISKLTETINKDKPYKDPDLTLQSLALLLNTKPHHLSQAINQKYQKGFSEYINQHRVREAQALLSDPKKAYLKIASIGFESGFNGLSTFNSTFKKYTGQTPSQFKREKQKS